jgi:hypothetical protein
VALAPVVTLQDLLDLLRVSVELVLEEPEVLDPAGDVLERIVWVGHAEPLCGPWHQLHHATSVLSLDRLTDRVWIVGGFVLGDGPRELGRHPVLLRDVVDHLVVGGWTGLIRHETYLPAGAP